MNSPPIILVTESDYQNVKKFGFACHQEALPVHHRPTLFWMGEKRPQLKVNLNKIDEYQKSCCNISHQMQLFFNKMTWKKFILLINGNFNWAGIDIEEICKKFLLQMPQKVLFRPFSSRVILPDFATLHRRGRCKHTCKKVDGLTFYKCKSSSTFWPDYRFNKLVIWSWPFLSYTCKSRCNESLSNKNLLCCLCSRQCCPRSLIWRNFCLASYPKRDQSCFYRTMFWGSALIFVFRIFAS